MGIGSAALAGAGTAGATTPQGSGPSTGIPSDNSWLAEAQGAVWDFGDAGAFGSAAGLALNHPIVTMTATKDQQGYWLVASDGGIFSLRRRRLLRLDGIHPPGATHRGHGGHP
jgi:hypothetical protein